MANPMKVLVELQAKQGLQVTGSTGLNGALTVEQASLLKGAVEAKAGMIVSGSEGFKVEHSAEIAENLFVGGTINVGGAATLADLLEVDGQAIVHGGLEVTGSTALVGGLTVSEDIAARSGSFSGDLAVTNAISAKSLTLSEDASIRDLSAEDGQFSATLSVGGASTLTGAVSMANTLAVAENATFAKDISAQDISARSASFSGDMDINGLMDVAGKSDLHGDVRMYGQAQVDGLAKLMASAEVTGTLNVTGDTTVVGYVTMQDNAQVDLSLSIGADATVGGNAIVQGYIAVTGFGEIGGTLSVDGASTLTGDVSMGGALSVDGNSSLAGTLTVAENVTFSKDLNVQDITARDISARSGSFSGDLVIAGNLQVNGTQTIINSTELSVEDLKIELARGAQNAAAANGGGIKLAGAEAEITYASATDLWETNKGLKVASKLYAPKTGSLSHAAPADGANGLDIAHAIYLLDQELSNNVGDIRSDINAAYELVRHRETGSFVGGTVTVSLPAKFAVSDMAYIALDVMVRNGSGDWENDIVAVHMFADGATVKVQIDAMSEVDTYRLIAVNEAEEAFAV